MASKFIAFLRARQKAVYGALVAAATAWYATGSLDWKTAVAAVLAALGINYTPNLKTA